MDDTSLPAPWTSRPCEHCGQEHPPVEDCLPEGDLDLLEVLEELFGPPEELLPGVLIFSWPK